MPTFAVTNAEIIVGGLDMSSFLNKATLQVLAGELDTTTFGQTWRTKLGGLREAKLFWDGFWTSVPDAAQFANLGVANVPTTVCPQGAETNVAYFFNGAELIYQEFGKIGDAAPFNAAVASSESTTGLIGGQLASLNRSIAATGQLGSILTIAGPSATQYIYATMHVLTAATTVTLQVQSAPTVGFASPTTRATIGPLTTTGGTFMPRVIGPFTDGFWRFNVSAITGTFVLSGAIGIQ